MGSPRCSQVQIIRWWKNDQAQLNSATIGFRGTSADQKSRALRKKAFTLIQDPWVQPKQSWYAKWTPRGGDGSALLRRYEAISSERNSGGSKCKIDDMPEEIERMYAWNLRLVIPKGKCHMPCSSSILWMERVSSNKASPLDVDSCSGLEVDQAWNSRMSSSSCWWSSM